MASGNDGRGYEITRLLGAGGLGEVYRARDVRLQRDVALKVLPASLLQDPDRRARFEREARVLASLSHPNIGHPRHGRALLNSFRGDVNAGRTSRGGREPAA